MGLVIIPLMPSRRTSDIALITTVASFLYTVYLSLLIDNTSSFQFLHSFSVFNTSFTLGIDGISMAFLLLTAFIMPICVLVSRDYIKMGVKQFY